MKHASILPTAILAAGLHLTSVDTAEAQDVQSFDVTTPQGQTITVPCDQLGNNGELTAEFLGTLDTSIHGHKGLNFFEMSEEDRAPYLDEIVEKNGGFNPGYLKRIFEVPYQQYARLDSEAEKIDYLQKKLDSHGMGREKVMQLVDVCNSLNND